MFNDKRSSIGVDVGGSAVRLAQLEPGDQGLAKIAAYSEIALPADLEIESAGYHQAVTQAIQQGKKQARFTGKTAISTLPAAAVQYKNLRLPDMPEADFDKAVQFEARERLQLGTRPHMIRYLEAGEVRQGEESRQEVIAMACPTDYVEAHGQSLTAAGLQLQAIEVVPSALARAAATLEGRGPTTDRSTEQTHLVIDVGHTSTKVLITRGERMVFFKLIPIGGQHFTQALAEAWGIEPTQAARGRSELDGDQASGPRSEQANDTDTDTGPDTDTVHCRGSNQDGSALDPVVAELGREIALCLRYYSVTFRGQRPAHGELVGGEAAQAWLGPMLSRHAGIEVSAINPLSWFDLPETSPIAGNQAGAWATAIGLALRSFEQANQNPSAETGKSHAGGDDHPSTLATLSTGSKSKGAAA